MSIHLDYNTVQMITVDPNIPRRIVGSAGLILAYGISLWRIFKSSPGDKFMEFACITVMLFIVILRLLKIPNFPTWVSEPLEVLLGLLAFVTVFFMFQQGYRALR